jgi:hypothetical protein
MARSLKHWRVWLLTTSIALTCLAAFLIGGRQSYQIDLPSYSKIKEGMKEEDVEALLGCPPGCYGDPSKVRLIVPPADQAVFTKNGLIIDFGGHPPMPRTLIERAWLGNDLLISVLFTEDGEVWSKHLNSFPREGFLQKLWRRFRELLP